MENTKEPGTNGDVKKETQEPDEDIKTILARLEATEAKQEALKSEQKRITSALDDAISGNEDEDDIDRMIRAGLPGDDHTQENVEGFVDDPEAYIRKMEAKMNAQGKVFAELLKKEREKHEEALNSLRASIREEAQRVVNVREEYLKFMTEHPYLRVAGAEDYVQYHFDKLLPQAEAQRWPVERFREELSKAITGSIEVIAKAREAHAAGKIPVPQYGYPTSTSQPPPKSFEEESAEVLAKQFEEETNPEQKLPHEEAL